jgi:glycosyltransferase involved in cell wall biosynthesis
VASSPLRVLFVASRLHPNYSDALRSLAAVYDVAVLTSFRRPNEHHSGLQVEHFESSWLSRIHERRAVAAGMHPIAFAYRKRSPGAWALARRLLREQIDVVYIRRDNRPLLTATRVAAALVRTPLVTYHQQVLDTTVAYDRAAAYPTRARATPLDAPNYLTLHLALSADDPRARPWRPEEGPLRVMAVGKLQERKGVQDVIAAVASLRERLPIALDVYGDYAEVVRGGNGDEVRRLAAQSGLGGALRFMPFVPQERMAAEYAQHHLYVYAGSVEGRPREPWTEVLARADGTGGSRNFSLLEAMRHALPVVVSGEPQVLGAVHHGRNGLVFPIGDVPALADAIVAASRADLGAWGARSRAIVAAHHDAARFPERFARLLAVHPSRRWA